MKKIQIWFSFVSLQSQREIHNFLGREEKQTHEPCAGFRVTWSSQLCCIMYMTNMHSYSASVTCNILPAFKITIVTCQCLLYDNKHVSLQLSAIKTLCWKLREIQYWNLNKTILIWLWKQPCIKVYVPNFITSSLLALFLITASAAEPRELWTPKGTH